MVRKDYCNFLENAKKGQLPGIVGDIILQAKLNRWGLGRRNKSRHLLCAV